MAVSATCTCTRAAHDLCSRVHALQLASSATLQLETLDITDNPQVTDVGLAALAAGCPHLRELYAGLHPGSHSTTAAVVTTGDEEGGGDTPRITDVGCKVLISKCRSLRRISLHGVPGVTWNTTCEAARLLRNVKEVSVMCAWCMSSVAVPATCVCVCTSGPAPTPVPLTLLPGVPLVVAGGPGLHRVL